MKHQSNMSDNQNNNIDNDPMEQEEIIGGNQPSMADCFPQANELTVVDFQKHFHRDGKCCISNLQNGLLPKCDVIMGFFCRAAEQGCKTQINDLSPLGLCHMSKTACMILEMQNTLANPHWDEDEVKLLPTVIVTAMALKSRCNANTISFFTGFHEAFKFMMQHRSNNNSCEQWAWKSLTNLDNTCPMLCSSVSPAKK